MGDSRRATARTRGRNLGALDRGISAALGIALAGMGFRRRTPFGRAAAMLGTSLLGRTLTGRCPVYRVLGLDSTAGLSRLRAGRIHRIEEAITLLRPVEVVAGQLERLEEVPHWLPRVESVEELGDRSHWVLAMPGGERVDWQIEIESDTPERIAWRSVDASPHPVQGELRLRPAPADRGTELSLTIECRGAPRLEKTLRRELREGLRRFKQLVEAGEVATTRGQPCGRAAKLGGVVR